MKNFKIYIFLAFLSLGDVSVSAQSMLDLYFGGNNDSLRNEAFKLIHAPEPTFKPAVHMTESDSATIADMELEQVYKSENRFFTVRDNKKIFAYRFIKQSDTSHNGARHNAQSFIFTKDWFSKL
jgi:hypothetical protein